MIGPNPQHTIPGIRRSCTVLTAVIIVGVSGPFADERRTRIAPEIANPSSSITGTSAECAVLGTAIDPPPSLSGGERFRGTTCRSVNTIEEYGSCAADVLFPGPDRQYAIEFTEDRNSLSAELSFETADLGLFVLSDCGKGTSCFMANDYVGVGVWEFVDVPRLGEGSFYIYIDSYYATGPESCGSYELFVYDGIPVELLEFRVE